MLDWLWYNSVPGYRYITYLNFDQNPVRQALFLLIYKWGKQCLQKLRNLPIFVSGILGREEKKESGVAQLCPTLCDPMDCSLPGFSVHGIFQAIVLEWAAIAFSRGSSRPRDWTRVSCIVNRHFTIWATRERRPSKKKKPIISTWMKKAFYSRLLQKPSWAFQHEEIISLRKILITFWSCLAVKEFS